jgi:hypothetical protein
MPGQFGRIAVNQEATIRQRRGHWQSSVANCAISSSSTSDPWHMPSPTALAGSNEKVTIYGCSERGMDNTRSAWENLASDRSLEGITHENLCVSVFPIAKPDE